MTKWQKQELLIKIQDRANKIGETIKSPKSQAVLKKHGSILLMIAIISFNNDLLIPLLLVRFGIELIKVTNEELDLIDYDASTIEKLKVIRDRYMEVYNSNQKHILNLSRYI